MTQQKIKAKGILLEPAVLKTIKLQTIDGHEFNLSVNGTSLQIDGVDELIRHIENPKYLRHIYAANGAAEYYRNHPAFDLSVPRDDKKEPPTPPTLTDLLNSQGGET